MMSDLTRGEGSQPVSAHEIAAWVLVGGGLLMVLRLHLLAALLAGLLVHQIVQILAPRLQRKLSNERARVVAVAALAFLIAGAVAATLIGLVAFVRGEGHLSRILEKLAESIGRARDNLPSSLSESLPSTADDLRDTAVHWLRSHAKEIRTIGADFGRVLAHIIVGLVVGAMVSLQHVRSHGQPRPLAAALHERVARLGQAFSRIVFAQVRISIINTVLSGLFLLIGLPVFGVHLPLGKTLVVLTFVFGLLPVVGNLISNTIVVLVAFSVSAPVAVAALAYLILIHKLEYFLNARIVGGQINARSWELLIAMLLMEAAFGLGGIIAAPIYYAYLKDELSVRGLI